MNYCTQDEHLRRKYAPIFRCHRICSHIAYAVLNPNPELTAHFPVWDHDPQRLSAVLDVNRHGEFATGQVARFFGTCLRCNSLEWNGHCAPQHLTLHSGNRTLHPVQPPGSKRSGKASPCIRYATGIAGRERKIDARGLYRGATRRITMMRRRGLNKRLAHSREGGNSVACNSSWIPAHRASDEPE